MRVAVRAWELREAARLALCAGDQAHALGLARAAWQLHATARGRRLLALALLATGQTADAGPLLEQASAAAPVAPDSPPDP
jgi:hypothetical protein